MADLSRVLGVDEDLQRDVNTFLMATARRLPIVIERGRGAYVWDRHGREYVDFVAGIAVNALGHAHPAVQRVLADQSSRVVHASNLYYTRQQVKLARRLVELSFPSRVFFCNSGAEANEAAIKLARKWGKQNRKGAYEIVTVEGSFHGRTLATIAATGQARYSQLYTPLPEGFTHVPFGDVDALRKACRDTTVAIMLEVMLGEGGMLLHPPGYLEAVRAWCDEQNLLLILDEVQTGIGRTGNWFGYQAFPIQPDVITVAKALAGGVPIGACLAAPRADVFAQGDHGSTFGGNPLACAVGLEVLRVIEEDGLLGNAREMGGLLVELVEQVDHVKQVRGMGLMQGCEFDVPIARDVELACLEHGVLVNAINETTLRLVPPLVIDAATVEEGVARMSKAVAKVVGTSAVANTHGGLP